MNKYKNLVLICLFLPVISHAQIEFQSCTLINNAKEPLNGYVKVRNRSIMITNNPQSSLYNAKTNTVIHYFNDSLFFKKGLPDELETLYAVSDYPTILINGEKYDRVYILSPDEDHSRHKYLINKIDGEISMYTYPYTLSGISNEAYFLKRGKKIIKVDIKQFKKQFSELIDSGEEDFINTIPKKIKDTSEMEKLVEIFNNKYS